MKTTYNYRTGWAIRLLIGVILAFLFFSCKKFLDAKPSKSLAVPSTLNDLQAILDYTSQMMVGTSYAEASADNYYLENDIYNSISDNVRKAYIWENFNYDYSNDWAKVYNVIYPANLVLESIEKITRASQTQTQWNNVKGSALLFRASALLQGSIVFCKGYDKETADIDLGMVLRLNPDINAKSVRSNLKETYERIIKDLKEAGSLLPSSPLHVVRPSQSAAYGLLARAYLSMQNYDSCLKYADLTLKIKDDLLDYNSLQNIESTSPFPVFNKEVIMATIVMNPTYYFISPSYAIVDSSLYKSYQEGDLRKKAFFRSDNKGVRFKGTYTGASELFVGIATDEVILMRAECHARLGKKDLAINDLNKLLENRWRNGSFIPLVANSDSEALSMILAERRKELIFRNLRWMDIKRLNREGAGIVLKRIVNGQTYTLQPNENRYALPLPLDIINITGIEQNPR